MATHRPLEQFNRLRDELDRAFGAVQMRAAGHPPVNAWEDDSNFYVEAELPGMKSEDLEILVEHGNELTIKGTRQQPELESGSWHRRERAYGSFSRTLSLGSDIDVDHVTAAFKHGVLTVTMPKSEAIKPKRIEITLSS